MIETICTPYGKAAFPTIVKCDGCGEVIGHYGTMTDEEHHYCDDCSTPANQEFRICLQCGEPMIEGMTNLETVYVCESCFKTWMDENCPEGWREVDDDGYDGYYEEMINGEWVGTGIFYTTWYQGGAMETEYNWGECPTNDEWKAYYKVERYSIAESVEWWLKDHDKDVSQEEFDTICKRVCNCDRGDEEYQLISYIYYDEVAG